MLNFIVTLWRDILCATGQHAYSKWSKNYYGSEGKVYQLRTCAHCNRSQVNKLI